MNVRGLKSARWLAVSTDAGMPAGDSGSIFTFAMVTMSFGAFALMIASSR